MKLILFIISTVALAAFLCGLAALICGIMCSLLIRQTYMFLEQHR